MFSDIEYETMASLTADEVLEFYGKQHHDAGETRDRVEQMLKSTCCLVTARRNGELIGFARGVTDGMWGRLAECKLDPAYQGPACVTKTDGRIEHDTGGIAREMAVRVIEALRSSGVRSVGVLAYGTEVDFCEDLGFKQQRGVVWMDLSGDSLGKVAQTASSHAQA